MSPRRQPLSLRQHCLNYLAQILDTLALNHRNDLDHPQIVTFLHHINTILPTNVQVAIGETIVNHNGHLLQNFQPSHIKILLRLKVRRLSISGSVVQSDLLESEDASHLEHLKLSYGGYGDKGAKLYNFLCTASHLTHLECIDFCTNTMMSIIASSCRSLYCLDLRGCDVTDEGVLRLCGLQVSLRESIEVLSAGGTLIPNSRCSETLKEIKFSMTKVTEAGVAIVLLVLTNIYLLRVPDIKMDQLFTFLKTIDHKEVQSKLKEFHSREILDENQLSVLTCLCPNLEYIQMSFVGNYDMDLARLQKLTSLRRLTGTKFADVNTNALIVFLSDVGSQLKSLFLYTYRTKFSQEKLKISHTHLWNLATWCPNLKSLTLDGYSLDEESLPIRCDNNSLQFFQSLHTLKLIAMNLSDKDLKVFLYKSTNMKILELALKDPHVLHDRFMSELLDEGVLKNLINVKIMNSPITIKMMVRLVDECPNLQIMGSLYTWLAARDQVTDFKERVRKQNLDVEIY